MTTILEKNIIHSHYKLAEIQDF